MNPVRLAEHLLHEATILRRPVKGGGWRSARQDHQRREGWSGGEYRMGANDAGHSWGPSQSQGRPLVESLESAGSGETKGIGRTTARGDPELCRAALWASKETLNRN